MSAENKYEKKTLHHQSYKTTYVPVESGVPQVSVLDPSIFIYNTFLYIVIMIYQSAFRNATILYLQMISLHTCTGSCMYLAIKSNINAGQHA